MSDEIVLGAPRPRLRRVCADSMGRWARAVSSSLLGLVAACAQPRVTVPAIETGGSPAPTATPTTAHPPPAPKEPAPAAVAFVEPCKPDTPEHDTASAALDALDERIKALPKTADPKPLLAELDALLELPCLEQAARHLPYQLAEADSGWALKDWWQRGGHSWIHFYLELGGPPPPYFDSHHI
ncbi:MAG TPA: hypothetical protein ENK57_21855, partial [Polyangiaceae bacterium]|nr:hypothetical protein [Polyangiaceae bacterium]